MRHYKRICPLISDIIWLPSIKRQFNLLARSTADFVNRELVTTMLEWQW
jgi:hypothetical protein